MLFFSVQPAKQLTKGKNLKNKQNKKKKKSKVHPWWVWFSNQIAEK